MPRYPCFTPTTHIPAVISILTTEWKYFIAKDTFEITWPKYRFNRQIVTRNICIIGYCNKFSNNNFLIAVLLIIIFSPCLFCLTHYQSSSLINLFDNRGACSNFEYHFHSFYEWITSKKRFVIFILRTDVSQSLYRGYPSCPVEIWNSLPGRAFA